MIKYIDNVLPANLENLATIMLTSIDQDKIDTKKRIDASLRNLEKEKLIIKNGDQFIFLTNEEQDINREIREIKIESSTIIDKVGDIIFGTLFGLNKKYRYSERYDFAFNSMIDDRARGAQKEEMGIRVITPLYAHGGDLSEQELKSISMRERNVVMMLPSDMTFIDEMEQAQQIDTFIRRNSGKVSTDVVEDIKSTKVREMKQRLARCEELIFEALKKADIYVNHNKLDIKEKAPTERANDAFKALVESIYTKQNYITKPFYTSDALKEILTAKEEQLILDGTVNSFPNHLAIEEMTDVVTRSSYKNIQTTMKTIIEYFNKIPYGWNEMDIAGILLILFKNQEVRLELGGENIAANDLNVINFVTKRDYVDRLLIKVRVKTPPALLTNAKNLAKDVFDRGDMPNDEDSLMERFKELVTNELYQKNGNIKDLLSEYGKQKYPGKKVLEDGKKLLEDINRIKDVKGFFEYLNTVREELLDYEEDMQDVKKFFANQREIFDKALKMLDIYEGNRSYVLDAETIKIIADIEKITDLASPYADIHKLPDLVDNFIKRFGALLDAECEPIRRDIEADKKTVRLEMEAKGFVHKYSDRVYNDFKSLFERLDRANNIYEAIAMRTESDRLKLRFIDEFIAEEMRIAALNANEDDKDKPQAPIRKTKTVSVKTLFSGTSQVSSKEDIDKLLAELKVKLEAQLEENTTIKII